jgi:hypothetical protein
VENNNQFRIAAKGIGYIKYKSPLKGVYPQGVSVPVTRMSGAKLAEGDMVQQQAAANQAALKRMPDFGQHHYSPAQSR